MPYGSKEIRRCPTSHGIIRTVYWPSPAFSCLLAPWMRSLAVVWINIVLAPKSCNFPAVAVVEEYIFLHSNFLDTSTRGIEMAFLYLLCAWDLYTCSVMKPLMRPLLSYSGFWRNMKSHYPESMNDICSPPPLLKPSTQCLVLWKGYATQKENESPHERAARLCPTIQQPLGFSVSGVQWGHYSYRTNTK